MGKIPCECLVCLSLYFPGAGTVTYLLERGNPGLLVIWRGIVHRHATPLLLQPQIPHERDPMIRPIPMAKEQRRNPVIGKILSKGAGGAGCLGRDVEACVHPRGEGIPTDELVEMGRRNETGGY